MKAAFCRFFYEFGRQQWKKGLAATGLRQEYNGVKRCVKKFADGRKPLQPAGNG
jgi:hypothetical protein